MTNNKIQKKIKAIAFFSILINIFLFILKIWVGIISNSISIIADAWHTLSDSITSIILFISVKLSEKPPDKEHPFGHGRYDLIAALIINVLLISIGVHFFQKSFARLHSTNFYEKSLFTIIVVIISIIVKEMMAIWAITSGKKFKSKALISDGWHHRSDAFTSLIVLISISFINKYPWIDGVLGILISCVIIFVAFFILKKSISSLIGEDINEGFKTEIINQIQKSYNYELNAHHFHLHEYGNHKELTFHINLPGNFTLEKSHTIATDIENDLKIKFKMEVTIHLEPIS
ncbi:MAG: cation diffusion facilitator family transporter [Candidatus Cloacimonetes bacterium]|nr:cation diffusion facilitator family transporter [Candidatus Cloacimonadota bacterium]